MRNIKRQKSAAFWSLFISLMYLAISGYWEDAPPALAITVEHPILLLGGDRGRPVSTRLSVTQLHCDGAGISYHWEQIQDVLSPDAARREDGKRVPFQSVDSAKATASFAALGVYEIKVTATDLQKHLSLSAKTWVNVWDSRSPIVVNGKRDPLSAAPGVNPPSSVRNLSPDPGPFQHPRIFCTNSDWAEIHHRCQEGILASAGLKAMERGLLKRERGLDSESSDFYRLTKELEA